MKIHRVVQSDDTWSAFEAVDIATVNTAQAGRKESRALRE
jgi:hypothetical protein